MEIKYLGVRGGKLLYVLNDDISLVKYEVNLYISPGLFFISRFIFDVLKHVRLPLVATKLLESYVNNCTDISLKVFSSKSTFWIRTHLNFAGGHVQCEKGPDESKGEFGVALCETKEKVGKDPMFKMTLR